MIIKQKFRKRNIIKYFKGDLETKYLLNRTRSALKYFIAYHYYKIKILSKLDTNGLYSKMFFRFTKVYRPIYEKQKTRYRKYYLERLQFRSFYGFFNKNFFRQKIKRSFGKLGALNHFIWAMECRVDVLLYRLRYIDTIRQAKQLIKKGFILVNGKVVKSPNRMIHSQDFFCLHPALVGFFKKKIHKSMKSSKYAGFFVPNYLELDDDGGYLYIMTLLNIHDIPWCITVNHKYLFLNIMNYYTRKVT